MKQLVPLVTGPAAMGAAIGLPVGGAEALHDAVALPAVLLGVAGLMIPALYIGAALLGRAPSARVVAAAAIGGLRAAGVVLLGLAAPAAFLLVTARAEGGLALLLGGAAVAAGAAAGVRALLARLRTEERRPMRELALYAGWIIVAGGIGLRLFVDHVAS